MFDSAYQQQSEKTLHIAVLMHAADTQQRRMFKSLSSSLQSLSNEIYYRVQCIDVYSPKQLGEVPELSGVVAIGDNWPLPELKSLLKRKRRQVPILGLSYGANTVAQLIGMLNRFDQNHIEVAFKDDLMAAEFVAVEFQRPGILCKWFSDQLIQMVKVETAFSLAHIENGWQPEAVSFDGQAIAFSCGTSGAYCLAVGFSIEERYCSQMLRDKVLTSFILAVRKHYCSKTTKATALRA